MEAPLLNETALSVPIVGPTLEEVTRQIRQAEKHADILEIRSDLFSFWDPIFLLDTLTKPIILTIKKERWVDSGPLDPVYIDIDWQDDVNKAKTIWSSATLIVSYHDFQKTGDLDAILEKMPKEADLYKIATMANSTLDALRMLLFVKSHHNLVGVCMGEKGAISRVLAPCMGSKIAYASVSRACQSAAGQIPVDELVERYHFKRLTPKTRIFGLIGYPVTKSPSHITHNKVIEYLDIDAVYVKMPVLKEEVADFLDLAMKVRIKGLSVTMPLKESLMEGAWNTLVFNNDSFSCINTDGKGALDAIEERMLVQGKTILIIGAGGAAKAMAKESALRGAHVIIVNRTLKDTVNLSLADALNNVPDYDILINATPVEDDSLIGLLKEGTVVLDSVVSKEATLFLQAAVQRKCRIIMGYEMLRNQAVLQFNAWLGECVSEDEIRKVFEKVFDDIC